MADTASRAAFNGVQLLDGSISANSHAVSVSQTPGLAIPPGGTVSADVLVDGRTITFDVTDTGGGVTVTARCNGVSLDTQPVVAALAEPGLEWQRTLGGTGDDTAYSVVPTDDGGYLVAGYSNSTDGDASSPGTGSWLVKLTAGGALDWERKLPAPANGNIFSINKTADGGFILAGSNGSFNAWALKLDGAGTQEWIRELGGSGRDAAQSIRQTNDGGYILAGFTESVDGDVTGNHGGRDLWVVKLTAAGQIAWEKAMGGTGSDGDLTMDVRQTADGGYVVAGVTASNDGDVTGAQGSKDMWVVKLSPDGLAGLATLNLAPVADDGGTLTFTGASVTLNAAMNTVTGIFVNGVARSNGLILQTGANAGDTRSVTVDSMRPEDLGLGAGWPSVLSHALAGASLTRLDAAMSAANTARADLGARYNALEYALKNLSGAAENLAAAESRIRDLDMAREAARMTKAAILTQASRRCSPRPTSSPSRCCSCSSRGSDFYQQYPPATPGDIIRPSHAWRAYGFIFWLLYECFFWFFLYAKKAAIRTPRPPGACPAGCRSRR